MRWHEKSIDPVIVEKVKAARKKISSAFRKVRKENILAVPRAPCCMGYSCVKLDPIAKKEHKIGCVYWHSRDEDMFKRTGVLNLRFYTIKEEKITTKDIGDHLFNALKGQGLNVVWGGNPDICIELKA